MAPTRSAVDNGRTPSAAPPSSAREPEAGGCLSEDPFVVLYHELRAPLGLIVTTARSAASECAEDSITRHRLETISRVAERTLRVTETVLALAREAAEGPGGEPFSPAAVLSGLVDDLSAEGGRSFQLVVQEPARDVRLVGRPAHFEGIVQALLTNALDHGAVDAPVRISLELADDTLCLTIDNPSRRKRAIAGSGSGPISPTASPPSSGGRSARLGSAMTSARASPSLSLRRANECRAPLCPASGIEPPSDRTPGTWTNGRGSP